jgi:hypothetical protein
VQLRGSRALRPVPFRVSVPGDTLAHIDRRVGAFPWERLCDAGGWSAGTGVASLRKLADRWTGGFSWRDAEARLNNYPQFRVELGGCALHYIHVRGSTRRALLLIHGWPGSCFEFLNVIEPLANPERFGGDPADGFDLIIPSLPGFAFSGAPAAPMGPRAIAGLFNSLMTGVLGYRRYIAQGGDWGSAISGWLAHDHPTACGAIHLNMALVQRSARPGHTASNVVICHG